MRPSAQNVQAGGRRVGEDTGGPIYLSHQGTGSADAQEWARGWAKGPVGICNAFVPVQRTSYVYQPRAWRLAGAQRVCVNW